MRMAGLMVLGLAFVLLVLARPGLAQSDECLVEVHDALGPVADGGSLCQTATGKKCVFDLQLCLDQALEGCVPVNFEKKQFRAKGHCGPVGQVRVHSSGTNAVCGDLAHVNVRTRVNGTRAGRCTIRSAVRSARTRARTDVDTVTLVCMPPSQPCPTTTTTTSSTTTTTSTVP
jgi:hypothetical protein